jgi:hypothetical protein
VAPFANRGQPGSLNTGRGATWRPRIRPALRCVINLIGQRLSALRDEIDSARRAGLRGQQIARFAEGPMQRCVGRIDLSRLLRRGLTAQAMQAGTGAIGRQPVALGAAEVMGDLSLLHAVLQAAVDWSAELTPSSVNWRLDLQPWPVRARVRAAMQGHELVVDYVPSVAAARQYCEDGIPQVQLFESSFSGDALHLLCERLKDQAPGMAFIEIVPTGHGCEMRGSSGNRSTRVGSGGLPQVLASVMLLELARRR